MVDLLVEAFAPFVGAERGTRGWIELKRAGTDGSISNKFVLQQVAIAHPEEADSLRAQLTRCRLPVPAALSPLPVADETYHETWTRDLPTDVPTVLKVAWMGTGKTTRLENFLRMKIAASPTIRVLIVSCRRSLTRFTEGELRARVAVDFVSYLDPRWSPTDQFMIVQVESLHRLDYARAPAVFDLVVLGEVESVISQLSSIETHKDNQNANIRAFERLVSGAAQVIALDAYLSARATDVLQLLRPSVRMWTSRNTYQPIKRDAIQLAPYMISDVRGRVNDVVNEQGLFEMIAADLKCDRKVVFVTTSKKVGDRALARFMTMFADKKLGFLSSGSTAATLNELNDVGTYWGQYDLIIYTSTVAVGVSFARPHFDCLYAYFSAAAVCVREGMQMLRRVRHFSRNRLVFVVQPKCGPHPLACNLEETIAWLQDREDLAVRKLPSHDASAEWFRLANAYNVAEVNESKSNFSSLLLAALEAAGHTLLVQEYVSEAMDTVEEPPAEWPPYDDVECISDCKAAAIKALCMTGAPTAEQRQQLKKHTMRLSFREDAPKCLITEEWATWGEHGMEAQFWRVVREKTMTLAQVRLAEARGHTALTARSRYHQREALQTVLRILCMEHSHELKTFDASALSVLLPSLQKVEDDVRKHMGIRPSDRKNRRKFNSGHAFDLLRAVFERWGVSVIKGDERRPKVNGVRMPRTYRIQIGDDEAAAFWRALSSRSLSA